mmetsp:Transcript_48258/g.119526  ORF Transcript_48258/g.119526 Transcript_48258/m.119526 type:complete len:287 (+) Transcript_48258:330-1190(+)
MCSSGSRRGGDLSISDWRSVLPLEYVNIPKLSRRVFRHSHFAVIEQCPFILFLDVANVVATRGVRPHVRNEAEQLVLSTAIIQWHIGCGSAGVTTTTSARRTESLRDSCIQVIHMREEPVSSALKIAFCHNEGSLCMLGREPHRRKSLHGTSVRLCSAVRARPAGSTRWREWVVEIRIFHVRKHPLHRRLRVGILHSDSRTLAAVLGETHRHQLCDDRLIRLERRGCCCSSSSSSRRGVVVRKQRLSLARAGAAQGAQVDLVGHLHLDGQLLGRPAIDVVPSHVDG